MEPNMSRQNFGIFGLIPDQWVVILQDEEGIAGTAVRTVRDFFCAGSAIVEAAPANTANVEFLLQESDDGVVWTNARLFTGALVPGGAIALAGKTVQARLRLLAFSHGSGIIKVTGIVPEAQASPDYLTGVALAGCAAYCEVACETGAET